MHDWEIDFGETMDIIRGITDSIGYVPNDILEMWDAYMYLDDNSAEIDKYLNNYKVIG